MALLLCTAMELIPRHCQHRARVTAACYRGEDDADAMGRSWERKAGADE